MSLHDVDMENSTLTILYVFFGYLPERNHAVIIPSPKYQSHPLRENILPTLISLQAIVTMPERDERNL